MQSLYFFIAIIVFFAVALVVSNYVQRKKGRTRPQETADPAIDVRTKQERDSGCCGMHETCEKDSLIAAFTQQPEYFDDEELDAYKNRDSNAYSEREADEFREVFYTIIDAEKPRWVRSLQTRGIAVPDQLKDEIVMLVNDLREAKMHA